MKNFQGIKSKNSFRVKYIHASFLYIFILWIESKYDRSKISIFHSQRAHFLSCLLRKKKKFTNWNILVQCGKFHPSNLFSFDFYIYLYIIFPKRSESKYQSKFFHTSYNHPPWILFSLFFFEFFFFFLFLYHHPDRVPLSSMTDCALLKDTPFLPPKKIPPDEVAL